MTYHPKILCLFLGLSWLGCKEEAAPDARLLHHQASASQDSQAKTGADDGNESDAKSTSAQATADGSKTDGSTASTLNSGDATSAMNGMASTATDMTSTGMANTGTTSTGTTTKVIHASDAIDPPPAGKRLRIMPLGASITQGSTGSKDTGYRGFLHQLLTDAKIDHEFVGSNTAQPGSLPKDQIHHEGHPGFTIDNDAAGLDKWLGPQGADPDYILILLGSNDIVQKKSAGMIDRMDKFITRIIDKEKGLRPNAQIIIASLPLMDDATMEKENTQYALDIVSMVVRRRTAGEKIAYIDVHSELKKADKNDNVHPNDAGYQKIAKLWFQRLTGH